MASLPYKSITSSPPFTFVVGPDQKEYTIHSALVAHQSQALNALVNGQMKEAIERRAIWKEIDEETFIRFSQYVYTGDYNEPELKKREAEAVAPNQGLEQPNAIQNPRRLVYEVPVVHRKSNSLWSSFQRLHPLPPTHSPSVSRFNGLDDDYTEVFLCHARTYIFADYYGINPLQALALCKLRQALTSFRLYTESRGDINRLIRYCFDKTVEKGGQADELRSLVCCYAACKVEDLWNNAGFQGLTRTLPDFSTGLVTAILGRLV